MPEPVQHSEAAEIRLRNIDCPLCGASEHRRIVQAKDPQWGIAGVFAVVRCDNCGHCFMNPRPEDEDLAACYPSNYGPHQNLPAQIVETSLAEAVPNEDATRPWYLKILPLKKVPGLRKFYFGLMNDRSQIAPNPDDVDVANVAEPKAFELGCAAGAYLQRLQRLGWNVQGLEPGNEAAATAKAAGLDVEQGLLETDRFADNSFDWIALWMVLEHTPNPREVLSTLHRMLRPQGSLAFSVPNAGCWEPLVFGRHWDAWDLPRHLQHFRPSTLRRLLQECGYTDIRIQHQRSLLNVIGSLGVCWIAWFPSSRIGRWLKQYPHEPRGWLQLLLAPLAHVLAWLRQGGRLTVTAVKPAGSEANESDIATSNKGPR